ncbi:MAG: TetR/AcrR family transcriptional regulator [Myxococcota bacterium]|jgi:AcrR family transcriptional regulator|nr:TetR/AcrR family transcriptional regulator [Myxococcota bacterium]HET9062928.1 TetR/AcrR family transcriptional regulator [Candidatus Binatia bacterium]
MQPAGRTPGKGERSRRELTEIAINCFARFGFQGTSIDRIARDAGVTKGAIYYHFKDKDDLLGAAVADRIQAFEDRVQRACEGIDASRALRRIAEVCVEHAQSLDHPRFVIKLMAESIDTNDKISTQLREMMRRFRAFLRNLIRQAQERGEFRTGIDAETVAAAYTSAVLGAEFQFYQDEERFRFVDAIRLFLDQTIADLERREAQRKDR